jgi:plastocyanin
MAIPSHRWLSRALGLCALLAFAGLTISALADQRPPKTRNQIIVPGEDRFTPFALTIRAGDFVKWTNTDTDDHTVVSDDFFNTAGNQGVNVLIPGTDSNNGNPGTLVLHFDKPGTFVYYCRFHAHLDAANQPAAPGPDGGIQDPNGNFGTPMSGVITVLPGKGGND